MSFEAEVIPLFIGGVLVVSSFELIVGCVLLKNKKSACKKFVLHVITMLIGFVQRNVVFVNEQNNLLTIMLFQKDA